MYKLVPPGFLGMPSACENPSTMKFSPVSVVPTHRLELSCILTESAQLSPAGPAGPVAPSSPAGPAPAPVPPVAPGTP